MQTPQAPPSSRHAKLEAASSALNANVALAEPLGSDGPESTAVSGAVASIVQLRLAGVVSVLPAPSVARTSKVWSPPARPVYSSGLEQALQLPPSRRHANVEPPSSALNASVAVVWFVEAGGPESIVVAGAVESSTYASPL